ncbi:MAG: DUF6502 family protein [Pseudomonadota bacterium]
MATPDEDPFPRLLRGLLRPLVRTFIARGLTAPALYRLLKRIYVEVAHEDFRIGDDPPTDSRISMMTGVHRRDVRTFLDEGDAGWEETRRRVATFATVLGQWLARTDTTDAQGRPLPLPRAAERGVSFEALVRDVSTDIRPRTVLDELLRQGVVEEGEDGLLRVAEGAAAGPGAEEDKLVFFAANVGDHIAAASENLLADAPPFYERAVFYTRLTDASLDAVEALAREKAQSLLEEINRESAAVQAADRAAPDNTGRYRLGVYFYRTAGSGAPSAGATTAPDADTTTDGD